MKKHFKYVLMCCRERDLSRELSVLGVFDTLREAQHAMWSDFSKYHIEELQMDADMFASGYCDASVTAYDMYNVGNMSAWTNAKAGDAADWKIVEIEIENEKATNQFVLLYSRGRELSILGVFDSLRKAAKAMGADYRKYHLEDLGLDEDKFDDDYEAENYEFVYDCGLDSDSAWSDVDKNNRVDWKVVEIKIEAKEEPKSLPEQMIANWKIAQDAGAWLPCPRCGCLSMHKDIHKNAYSRRADVYVCDDCGMLEAVEAIPSSKVQPIPLEQWFIGSFE